MKKQKNNPYLYASLRIKEGMEKQFIAKLEEAVGELKQRYGIVLAGSYRVSDDSRSFINLWSVPDDEQLQKLMADHESNAITVTHELDELIESEESKVVRPVALGAEEAAEDDDWAVILVDEVGRLYRLEKDVWTNPTYQVTGDDAVKIRESYVVPNSITAKVPYTPGAFFACWFTNVRILNLGAWPTDSSE